MSIITSGTIPKALVPSAVGFFGAAYEKYQREFTDVYDVTKSERAFEEMVELINAGLAMVKNETASLTFSRLGQGGIHRATHVTYGAALRLSEEAVADNQYMEVAEQRSQALARMMSNTENIVSMLPLNRAFDVAYAREDGVPLCSASHPTEKNGVQSNLLNHDLSHAALEDAVILAKKTDANDGTPIMGMVKQLIVPTDLELLANKIIKSVNESGTANNDINVLRAMNAFPNGVRSKRFLTLTGAWFVQKDYGTPIFYERMAPTMQNNVEFISGNIEMKAVMRISTLWHEWRNLVGSSPL